MQWLKEFCYKVQVIWNSITYVPDYTVKGVYMQYSADAVFDLDVKNSLWIDEAKYWDSVDTWYDWDLTSVYRKGGIDALRQIMQNKPDEVNECIMFIRYTYGVKEYTFATRDPEFVWTPDKVWKDDTLKFRFPMSEAWAVDSNGRKVVNITERIRSVAGPRGDFHHQDVHLKHIMGYDYPAVQVKNLLHTEMYDEDDSVLII